MAMTDAELVDRIVAASRKIVANGVATIGLPEGGDLLTEAFGVKHTPERLWHVSGTCVCPIGAILIVEQPPIVGEAHPEAATYDSEHDACLATVAALLERSEAWLSGFVAAVDGFKRDPDKKYRETHDGDAGYACGRRVRKALALEYVDP